MNLVNKQLELMGYNIGIRLVDELLAKSSLNTCGDFKYHAFTQQKTVILFIIFTI